MATALIFARGTTGATCRCVIARCLLGDYENLSAIPTRIVVVCGWLYTHRHTYHPLYIWQEYIRATKPAFAVGEFWDELCYQQDNTLARDQNPHRQRTVDWCDSTSGTAAAFDFTTKGILQEALASREFSRLVDKDNKPAGVMGWWPSRAVTWIENHDTGSTQNHWPFPAKLLSSGYAYILTHPGTPCVFYDHMFADGGRSRRLSDCLQQRLGCMGGSSGGARLTALGTSIMSMIDIRRRNNITCSSVVRVCEATDHGVYAALVDERVALRLGGGVWQPPTVGGATWRVALCGLFFCIWELVVCSNKGGCGGVHDGGLHNGGSSAPPHAVVVAGNSVSMLVDEEDVVLVDGDQRQQKGVQHAGDGTCSSLTDVDDGMMVLEEGTSAAAAASLPATAGCSSTPSHLDEDAHPVPSPSPSAGYSTKHHQPVAACQLDVLGRISASTDASHHALLAAEAARSTGVHSGFDVVGGFDVGPLQEVVLGTRDSQRQLLVHT